MLFAITTLPLLFLVAVPSQARAELHEEYEKINKYLIDSIATNGASENMAKAAEWASTLESSQSEGQLLEALRQFIALESVAKPEKCNREGYELLRANDRGTGVGPSDWWLEKPTTRVDELVRHYANEYALLCGKLFPDLLAAKMSQLNDESRSIVRKLAELGAKPWSDYDRAILNTILEYSKQDIASLNENKSQIGQLFQEFIVNPCNELDVKVGAEYEAALEYVYNLLPSNDVPQDELDKQLDRWYVQKSLLICEFIREKPEETLERVLGQLEDDAE